MVDKTEDQVREDLAAAVVDAAVVDSGKQNQDAKNEGDTPAVSSSDAGKKDEPKDTVSVIRDVVAKDKEAKAKAKPESSTGEVKVEAGKDQKADGKKEGAKAEDPADYSDVPFNAHPRFRKLLDERDGLKNQVEAAKREVETIKPDADRYGKVVSFIEQHGMTSEEAADGLVMLALAKTNPSLAWEKAQKWITDLAVASGQLLPAELQERVKAGTLTVEDAKAISVANAKAKSVEIARDAELKQRERESAQRVQAEVQGSVNEWFEDRKKKDPNFEKKWPIFISQLEAIHYRNGVGKTKDDALAQLKDAYEFANANYRPVTAPPQRKTVVPLRSDTPSASAASASADEIPDTLSIVRSKVAARMGGGM